MTEKPVALVTGASRGIGAATAVELARRGFHVVATARTEGGLTETDDAIAAAAGTATLLPFDLRDGEKIDVIGPSVFDRFGRLDVLVHAAGTIGKLTPVAHIVPADWEQAFAVNFAATWRLIRSCAPILLAAPAGRAAFLTTPHADHAVAYWGAYGATKAGMQNLVLSWAAEVARTKLRVNLLDPGRVRTRLRIDAYPGADLSPLPGPEDVAPALADLCLPAMKANGQILRLKHP